jgi:hypothetical protein
VYKGIRYGLVRGNFGTGQDAGVKVAAYLPANYRVLAVTTHPAYPSQTVPDTVVVIQGNDKFGWTLDGYVAPRLGSGMMVCEEIGLDHPVMKLIPA